MREAASADDWSINLVTQVNPSGQRQFRTIIADAFAPYIVNPVITDAFDPGVDAKIAAIPTSIAVSKAARTTIVTVFSVMPSPMATHAPVTTFVETDYGLAPFGTSESANLHSAEMPIEAVERAFAELDQSELQTSARNFGMDTRTQEMSKDADTSPLERQSADFEANELISNEQWRQDFDAPVAWKKPRRKLFPPDDEPSSDEYVSEFHL